MNKAISNPKAITLDSLLYRVVTTTLEGSVKRTHSNLEILQVNAVSKMPNDTGRSVDGDLVREDNLEKVPGSSPIENVPIYYNQSGRAFGMETWTDDKDQALDLLTTQLRKEHASAVLARDEWDKYITVVQFAIDNAVKNAGGKSVRITISEDED